MHQEKQDENKIRIVRPLIEELKGEEPQDPPKLRIIDHRKFKESMAKVNEVLKYFQAVNLRELNDLPKSVTNVVEKMVGYKRGTKENKQKEPWWKLILESHKERFKPVRHRYKQKAR